MRLAGTLAGTDSADKLTTKRHSSAGGRLVDHVYVFRSPAENLGHNRADGGGFYGERFAAFQFGLEHLDDDRAQLRTEVDHVLSVIPSLLLACPDPGAGWLRAEQLAERIRQRVVASGSHYLVLATLRGKRWLRCTLMNPRTERRHLVDMLQRLRSAGSEP